MVTSGCFDNENRLIAAKSRLPAVATGHRTFAELASQTRNWKLTANDLRRLSRMSLRPKP
jgi:hypothetical protein